MASSLVSHPPPPRPSTLHATITNIFLPFRADDTISYWEADPGRGSLGATWKIPCTWCENLDGSPGLPFPLAFPPILRAPCVLLPWGTQLAGPPGTVCPCIRPRAFLLLTCTLRWPPPPILHLGKSRAFTTSSKKGFIPHPPPLSLFFFIQRERERGDRIFLRECVFSGIIVGFKILLYIVGCTGA